MNRFNLNAETRRRGEEQRGLSRSFCAANNSIVSSLQKTLFSPRLRASAVKHFFIRAFCILTIAFGSGCKSTCHAEANDCVLKSEFIYETAPFPECHASTIVESGGTLVAAWFGGTKERNPDVGIWLARNEHGKWTAPVEVANGVQSPTNRFACWNPVLFQPSRGPLLLFYKVGPSPGGWWGMMMRSTNSGVTWSAAEHLPDGILGPIKNKPVELPDGTILCPASTEGKGGWRVHFESTTDFGKTWKSTPPINDGTNIAAIQPSILFHPHNRLEALGRTKQERIFEVWSDNLGKTWQPMKLTTLPNPNSGTDAVNLADGRFLLVYNHNPNPKGRSPLNVAISSDGELWKPVLTLERDPTAQFSYPAVIQTRDGLVHITYTWKRLRIRHVVLDPAKFVTREFVSGEWPADAVKN